jgi:hypothetical protein
MTLIIIFTLGYAIGGVSALMLFGLMLAGRERGATSHHKLAGHDA